jgi:hypothetical protein
VSDFSSAGAAYLSTYGHLPDGFVKAGLGEDGYFSALIADSMPAGTAGEFLYGVQAHRYDGPWTDIDEDVKRGNVLLRYTHHTEAGGWNVAFMGYDASWNSPDQIPLRAVQSGLIDELGSIDKTLGGQTSRYSLSGAWNGEIGKGSARATAYLVDYDLDLFSNFTYFLDDAVDGDQFNQHDERTVSGGNFTYTLGGDRSHHTLGAQLRRDDIGNVGLYRTRMRQRVSTVRSDVVDERTVGAYYSNETHWSNRLRTILGVRADWFDFDVASDLAANSGIASQAIVSPKASVIYAVGDKTELYASAGQGFHSNDARGTTIRVDPVSGDPAARVDPLVKSKEVEVGFRSFVDRKLNMSAALWYLTLDSELLFVGDAGNTEPSRRSRRYGLEVPVYYRPNDRLTLDFELALTHSEFSDGDPVGSKIPGAIDRVLGAGVAFQAPRGFYSAVRLRYFGPRPLIEDGSVESGSSAVLNLEAGYKRGRMDFRVDLLNAFNSHDDDITYWYASRLPGEPVAGAEDYHFHPIEPRNVRAYFSLKF